MRTASATCGVMKMTERDDAAAAYYELEANRQVEGPAHKRSSVAKRLSSHVPVRFEARSIEAVRRFADEDGMTVSSWIRAIVEREVQWRLARLSTTSHVVSVTFELLEGPTPVTQTGFMHDAVPA